MYKNFLVYENCHLIRHWCKFTDQQKTHTVDELFGQQLIPKHAIINVRDIVCPVVGLSDPTNPLPFSYLFLPCRALWAQFFVERMHQLLKESRKRKHD